MKQNKTKKSSHRQIWSTFGSHSCVFYEWSSSKTTTTKQKKSVNIKKKKKKMTLYLSFSWNHLGEQYICLSIIVFTLYKPLNSVPLGSAAANERRFSQWIQVNRFSHIVFSISLFLRERTPSSVCTDWKFPKCFLTALSLSLDQSIDWSIDQSANLIFISGGNNENPTRNQNGQRFVFLFSTPSNKPVICGP